MLGPVWNQALILRDGRRDRPVELGDQLVPLAYVPDPNYNGRDRFTYTITDGTSTLTYTISVNVTPVNDAPVGTDGTTKTEQDTPVIGSLPPVVDVDGDPVEYGVGSQSDNGTVIVNPDGTFTYVPNSGLLRDRQFHLHRD